MCGIVGIVDLGAATLDPALLKSMTDAIHYRGPDDEGYVLINQGKSHYQAYSGPASPESVRATLPSISSARDFPANIGLAHRRFSIIDLSPGGHQPLFSSDNSCCVVFNGEIYNYIELREELIKLGVIFRSTSDTEVLLEAYRIWDTDCFNRFNGFWALALYDFKKRRLILSRDRLGKKPLYWTQFGSKLYFASEIKSLLRVTAVSNGRKANEDAIWHWCVDGRRDLDNSTFFDGIRSLPAACWTIVDEKFPNNIQTFWEVPRKRLRESDISIPEAMQLVRETLDDAVRIRLRADVPLALELSGGLDSSTVLALAARHHPGRITTYTVKFADPRWNEEPFARSIANRYDVDYRMIEPEMGGFWHGIRAFTELQEEPYHSPNMQTSQVIWSLMRSEGTKVALTGAAGDEMFAGYGRYYVKAQIENLMHGQFNHFIDNARNWTERNLGFSGFVREMVGVTGLRSLVRRVKSAIPEFENQYIKGIAMPSKQYYAASLTEWLREEITNTQIPYWLRSGEKTYMGMPFEARLPFLDYHVVEAATQIPVTYLIRHGWHKWILRKAMEDLLPADVVWRRVKMGFPYPYEQFFTSYRKIIDLILTEARNPYIDVRRHIQLRTDWNAISFILWYEYFINENKLLFRKIEENIATMEPHVATTFTPEFMKACSQQTNNVLV